MPLAPRLASLFRNLFHRSRVEHDLRDELNAYTGLLADEKIARGATAETARRQALVETGGVEQVVEEVRAVRMGHIMETIWQDLRYGFRVLAKAPAFTLVAVLTLALGIGANTAIFSILNALLLRTLPVERPQELSIVGNPARVHAHSSGSPRTDLLSFPMYRELLARNQVFTGLAGTGDFYRPMIAIEEGGRVPPAERVRARLVTGNYFSVLGVKPLLGRTFTAEDDSAPGKDPFVVLSYSYWTRRFNQNPNALGRTVRVNGYPFTIIGVAAPGFTGEVVGDNADIWVPAMMQAQVMPGRDWIDDASQSWLVLIGRRKPGITDQKAQAALNVDFQAIAASTFAQRFEKEDQDSLRKLKLSVVDGSRGLSGLRAQFSTPLMLLMGIVALVLLIACVNVANLLLARASARQTEMAARLAIGASPGRIVRQLLTESVLLAFFGGAIGVVLSLWGTAALVHLVAGDAPSAPLQVAPDLVVLGFTAGVSLLTGILFGLAPAMRARGVQLTDALKQGPRGGSAAQMRPTTGRVLVSAQVVLSVLVVFTALLLVRSLKNLQDVDTGYKRAGLLIVGVDPIAGGYKGPKMPIMADQLAERFRRLPGVESATYSENGLFNGTESAEGIIAEGFTPQHQEDKIAYEDVIGPDYFSALGIPLLRGREIRAQDAPGGSPVVVINQTMAHFYFADRDPIGRKIYIDDEKGRAQPIEIVGVVPDIRDHNLREAVHRRFYARLGQIAEQPPNIYFELRVADNAATVSEAARNAVRDFDANLPVVTVKTVNSLVEDLLSDQIVIAKLSGLFAALALALACIGLYGLTAYSVAGRTREIGLRMALGAESSDLLWLVLREALVLVSAGVVVGIPLAMASSRVLSSLLFQVSAVDPLALFGCVVLLGGVAIAAAYIPARRATRIPPMAALRYE